MDIKNLCLGLDIWVPQVMEADAGQAVVLGDRVEPVPQAGALEMGHMVVGCFLFRCAQTGHDVVRSADCPCRAGGLGPLLHPLVVPAADQRLFDGDGPTLKIDAVPGQSRDLRRPHAHPDSQQDRDLHYSPLHRPQEDPDLLGLKDRLLLPLLLREGGVQFQPRAVLSQDGGEQAVDIAQRLRRSLLDLALLVGVGLGGLVHGLLDHLRGELVELDGRELRKRVAADDVVAADGGGAEDAVLALDVLLHGLPQRHGGGVSGDLLVVHLPLQSLVLRLLLGGAGEGAVLGPPLRVFPSIDLDSPGAAGQLFCRCHLVFLPYV